MDLRERRDISENDHTATAALAAVLQKMQKTSKTLILPPSAGGYIDFSVLSDLGFHSIETIEFERGVPESEKRYITAIFGLPRTLKKFVCTDNKLLVLENLPDSLLHLDVASNQLTTLDCLPLIRLETLKCGDNKLAELTGFPESLLELHCENNQIAKLDLSTCPRLAVLDAKNNHSRLVIQHRPASLGDLRMDSNSFVEIDHRPADDAPKADVAQRGGSGDDTRNYKDALDEYFRIKTQYETGVAKQRRSAFERARAKGLSVVRAGKLAAEVVPLCFQCRARGGTLFWKKNHRYVAECGATEKCGLDIKLFSGVYVDFKEVLADAEEELEVAKQNIILQKMDAIFGYVNESRAAEDFKILLEQYVASSEVYKNLRDEHDLLYNNSSTKELMSRKTELLDSYIDQLREMQEQQNKTDSANIYIHDIIPVVSYIRSLVYPVMEMKSGDDEGRNTLFQRNAPTSSITYLIGEEPKVVKFTRNS